MIELSFNLGGDLDVYKVITWYNNLFGWFLSELQKTSEEAKGWIEGYLILHDMTSNSVGALILTSEGAPEGKLIQILQQPPGEFNAGERYQAHVVSKVEPAVVTEKVKNEGLKRPASPGLSISPETETDSEEMSEISDET